MRRPYGESAGYYDAFYSGRVDYEGDVRYLKQVFKRFGSPDLKKVLDLGAGTASHAVLLAKEKFQVDCVDVSEALLDVAEVKVKGEGVAKRVRLHRMDMTKKLPEGKFDAAISMFGAWCYLRTDEDASKTLSMLRQRLPEGGLLVFEFWSPLGWNPQPRWDEADLADGSRIVRLTRPGLELKNDVYEYEMEHIVIKDARLVANFSEVHGLRLRTPYQTQALLERNGFEVLAFTKGDREGKALAAPSPNEFRVMCVARRA
ncbi:MAG TPA: class I SAM-dependent methyltransferase [Candidatus Thermoplasmatota archaeon]|nr:class I SAM-dependent methyltransferase [Candidatus Thermoplasmatota archaeon]